MVAEFALFVSEVAAAFLDARAAAAEVAAFNSEINALAADSPAAD